MLRSDASSPPARPATCWTALERSAASVAMPRPAVETPRRGSHEPRAILPMGLRRWPYRSPHMVQGFISRPQQGYRGSHRELLGVVLGSLGRGMQADGV